MVIWSRRVAAGIGAAAQRPGVRGLRHRGARIPVERLCRKPTCGARPFVVRDGQRPRLWLEGSKGLQGQCRDLLRTVDVQDGGGDAAWRRRRAAGSRHAGRRRRLERRGQRAHGWTTARIRPRRTTAPGLRPWKAGCPPRATARAVRAGGASTSTRPPPPRHSARLQADRHGTESVDAVVHETDPAPQFAERHRHPARRPAQARVRALWCALGSSGPPVRAGRRRALERGRRRCRGSRGSADAGAVLGAHATAG